MKNIIRSLCLIILYATVAVAQPTSGHQEVTIDERFQRSDAFGILKLEDSASASGDAGVQCLAARNDNVAVLTNTDGDYSSMSVDSRGRPLTVVHAVNVGTGIQLGWYPEDAAASSGDSGIPALSVRNDTDTALTGADGDYGAVSIDSAGRQKLSVGAALFQSFSGGANYGLTDQAEAGSTTTVINATTHGAKIGDLITFGPSSSARAGQSWVVSTTANTITIAPPLPVAPNTNDFFYMSRPQAQAMDNFGRSYVRLNDSAGNNLDKTIDAAFTAGSTGLQPLFRMADSTLISAATTATNGRMGVALMDRDGRVFANIDGSGVTQIGTTCSAAATTTADTQIKAGISSTRIYVRAISCKNNSAVPSGIVFKDGSTTVWVGAVGAVGDEFVVASLFPPLRGSVNTAFNFAMDVTSTSTICCADWYLDGD